MLKSAAISPSGNYDPRWFIWTIVFLIVAGFSLVGYLTVVGYNESNTVIDLPRHIPVKK